MAKAADGATDLYGVIFKPRDREFRDAFLGAEDVFGAADHVAALRELASNRLYMDLSRTGVLGSSFGGYGALRATLLHPDFFRVMRSFQSQLGGPVAR